MNGSDVPTTIRSAICIYDDTYKHKLSDSQKIQILERLKERVPTGFAKHRQMLPETQQVLEKITEELQPTDYVKEHLEPYMTRGVLERIDGLCIIGTVCHIKRRIRQ